MHSIGPFNSVTGGETSFDTVRLIIVMIGTFFLGALTASIQRGKKEQGWFNFKKPNRTKQTKEQMQYLENIANNANDSE